MKNFRVLLVSLALLASMVHPVFALQTGTINTPQLVNQNTVSKVQEGKAPNPLEYLLKYNELMERYAKNLRLCEPVHISQQVDLFGLKLSYKFDINGWVDSKCSYYGTFNVGGLGTDVREVFGIKVPEESLAAIKPEFKCDFTREQLDVLVDGFVAMQKRKDAKLEKVLSGEEQLVSYQKNDLTPAAKNSMVSIKDELSPEEEKLIAMLASGNVCKILNQDKLFQQILDLSKNQL